MTQYKSTKQLAEEMADQQQQYKNLNMNERSSHTSTVTEGGSAKVIAGSLDLSDPSLRTAVDAVRNAQSAGAFVLLGLKAGTNQVEVVSEGSGGVEELAFDMSDSRVHYALVALDAGDQSVKTVFINWVPEGLPAALRGNCARHTSEFEAWVGYFHARVDARTDDDLDEEKLVEKLKKVGA